jgi:HPt (histidine-containing phosphotransfer) domain-containing protein
LDDTAVSAVDAASLAALKEDGSLLRELRDLFAVEAPEQVARMLAAQRQADGKAMAQAAHRLKGTATTFGAREMQRICIELEALARSGALDGAEGKIQALSAECDRVKAALDQALEPAA